MTPSITARSVSRRAPVRSSVASVEAAVRLISRGPFLTASVTSPYSASPIAIWLSALVAESSVAMTHKHS